MQRVWSIGGVREEILSLSFFGEFSEKYDGLVPTCNSFFGFSLKAKQDSKSFWHSNSLTAVHCHVPYFTLHDPNQLRLPGILLVVQPPEGVPYRPRMIILHKGFCYSLFLITFLTVGFQ